MTKISFVRFSAVISENDNYNLVLSHLLQGSQAFFQGSDQILCLLSLLPLSGNHGLGGTGNELLVAQLAFQSGQVLLGFFQILVDPLQLLGNVHQLTHGIYSLASAVVMVTMPSRFAGSASRMDTVSA